jgi:hypothetical protein
MRIDLRLWILVLVLLILPSSALAATRIWTGQGTNNLWSNPANWDSGIPINGDDLRVGGATFNDLVGLEVHSIAGSGSTGNRIWLGAGGISVGPTATIGLPITLTASQQWSNGFGIDGASMTIEGDVDLGTSSLSITSGAQRHGAITINGTITGGGALSIGSWNGPVAVYGHINTSGPVSFAAANSVSFYSTNSFVGPLTINGGGYCTGVSLHSLNALPSGVTIAGFGFVLAIGSHSVHVGTMDVETSSSLCVGLVGSNGGTLTIGGPGTGTAAGAFLGTGSLVVTGGSHTLTSGYTPDIYSGSLAVTGGSLTLTQKRFGAVSAAIGPGTLRLEGSSLGPTTLAGGRLELGIGWPIYSQLSALSMDAASTFIPQQGILLRVSGSVSLGNAQFVVQPTPNWNTPFEIIQNDGTAPVSGTFAGLPEGATFTVDGTRYRISYQGGDGNDVTATDAGPELPATKTVLTAMADSAPFGSAITLTAMVSSTRDAVTGEVTFFDGSAAIGTSSLDVRGAATFTTSTLALGTHTLTAWYRGTSENRESTSDPISLAITRAPTELTLSSSPNPSSQGRSVTLTAIVSPHFPSASGSVTFLGATGVIGKADVNADGTATVATSFSSEGVHGLSANYSGSDVQFPSASPMIQHVVVSPGAPTTTELTAVPNPSQHEQPVELTAVVRAAGGLPHGTITFSADGASLGSASLDDAGWAFLTTSALPDGVHTLVAVYPGANGFEASASPSISHTVLPGPAACSWPVFATPLENVSVAWRSKVTLTASVTGDQPLTFHWYRGKYPDTSTKIESTSVGPSSSSFTIENLTAPAEIWVLATNACGSAHASMRITVLPHVRKRATPH